MKPRDAARILEALPDEEAEILLARISPRQASRILGELDPGRAARLSRLVLGTADLAEETDEAVAESDPEESGVWMEETTW